MRRMPGSARTRVAVSPLVIPGLAPLAANSAADTAPGTYEASKRALDVVLSLSLLIASLPLLCLAGIAILVTTRQVPLFVQRRIGLGGNEFKMLKLRTMDHRGTRAPLDVLLSGDVLVRKLRQDERVTPVGRLLRATSIDELPQLVNVVAGSMSLVGPRPGLPQEVSRYPVSWRRRLVVKPGITGLWQVSGRGEIDPARRVAMDRYYISHRSTAFDCLLLLRTIMAVASTRGAW